MTEMVDESLGMLLDELEVLGLSENTVVVLYSDTGRLICEIELGTTGFFDVRRWMTAEVELNKLTEGIQWSKDPDSGVLSYDILTVEPRIFEPQYYYLAIHLSEINKTALDQNWLY